MNLLFDEDIKNKQYFDIILLINAVKESKFNSFIETISSKSNWVEELCCCTFDDSDDEYYLLETFEGNDFTMHYDEFIKYVKLAIIRYLLACESEENKEATKKTVNNTIFASVLNNIDESLASGVPLVY